MGGSKGAENHVGFTQSATTGFIASVFPSRSRVSFKKAFAGPELCDWKLSRTVLRGLDGSNPVRLLAKAGVISAWFRSVPTACLFVCKPSMLIRQDNEFVTVVFLDTIERQPVLDKQRRYRLSTIPQKPIRMAAIARVHDIARVKSCFDCSYCHYPHAAKFVGEPRQCSVPTA